jgi:hypothetical protein
MADVDDDPWMRYDPNKTRAKATMRAWSGERRREILSAAREESRKRAEAYARALDEAREEFVEALRRRHEARKGARGMMEGGFDGGERLRGDDEKYGDDYEYSAVEALTSTPTPLRSKRPPEISVVRENEHRTSATPRRSARDRSRRVLDAESDARLAALAASASARTRRTREEGGTPRASPFGSARRLRVDTKKKTAGGHDDGDDDDLLRSVADMVRKAERLRVSLSPFREP